MGGKASRGSVENACMIMVVYRIYIALLFGQFHTAKAILGAKFLKLNKEKGWLIPPPLHLQVPENK